MARGSKPIPDECRRAIDSEYPDLGPFGTLNLPLKPKIPSDARWNTFAEVRALYQSEPGRADEGEICDDDCGMWRHTSLLGSYFSALTIYATLFKESPIGARVPDGNASVDDVPLGAIEAADNTTGAIQRIVSDVVLDHLDIWWAKKDKVTVLTQ